MDRARAEELFRRITEDEDAASQGALLNDLLREFYRGFPIDRLRSLLSSQRSAVVAAGVWIASELGEGGAPLLSDIVPLLHHSERKVRFSAIECVLLWAQPEDQAALGSVLAMLNDPDAGVRWKAMDFWARATPQQIRSALDWIEDQKDFDRGEGLRLLASPASQDAAKLVELLDASDVAMRKYAAIAAVRISKRDPRALLHASAINDADVRGFAETALALL
jgi:hypothetical protein